jgi:hypothetical protein
MGDLKSSKVMWVKGGLFLFGGVLAAVLVVIERPSWKVAGLLAAAIWCFCRAYYFAFYVIEHYIDGGYKFAGLSSFVRYMVRNRGACRRKNDNDG